MTVSNTAVSAPKSIAALYALMCEQNAALVGQMVALTGVVTTLTTALTEGQFSTPTLVAEAVTQTAAPKGKGKKGAQAKPAAAPKATDPEKAQAWALVKADREALSPLNKAYSALGCKGDAWAGRFADEVLTAQALKALTPAQRKAAKDALVRKAEKAAAK